MIFSRKFCSKILCELFDIPNFIIKLEPLSAHKQS